MSVSSSNHHIVSMDMYAITAFGTIEGRDPTYRNDFKKIIILSGFRKYDSFLKEMDKKEVIAIKNEYKIIYKKETTGVQKVQNVILGGSLLGFLGGTGLLIGSFIVGPFFVPAGFVLGGLAATTYVASATGVVASSIRNPSLTDKEENGVPYLDQPRLKRLREKIRVLQVSLQDFSDDISSVAYRQHEQAMKFFKKVVKEYENYHHSD